MGIPAFPRSWISALLLCSASALAQQVTLSAHVALVNDEHRAQSTQAGNVVVWLSPDQSPAPSPAKLPHARLTQKNKSFEPHLLVIPVGSVVEFPNRDPFFHNVFSLFEGKRFDLGLYEAGSTREVTFSKPGISFIFCNIHAEMNAVIIALETPYYGISNQHGDVVIPDVPLGHYTLKVWYEGALPEALNAMTREITVSESTSTLGILRIATASLPHSHKNKYDRDYDPPGPDNPAYQHP
jgi:plastocyanin